MELPDAALERLERKDIGDTPEDVAFAEDKSKKKKESWKSERPKPHLDSSVYGEYNIEDLAK